MNKNYNMKTAELLLDSFEKKDWRVLQAKRLLSCLKKESSDPDVEEIMQSPYYQNIVNILGPYAVYYKIDQVLKLLEEFKRGEKEPDRFKSPYYARPKGG